MHNVKFPDTQACLGSNLSTQRVGIAPTLLLATPTFRDTLFVLSRRRAAGGDQPAERALGQHPGRAGRAAGDAARQPLPGLPRPQALPAALLLRQCAGAPLPSFMAMQWRVNVHYSNVLREKTLIKHSQRAQKRADTLCCQACFCDGERPPDSCDALHQN